MHRCNMHTNTCICTKTSWAQESTGLYPGLYLCILSICYIIVGYDTPDVDAYNELSSADSSGEVCAYYNMCEGPL